ncbi:unnamed protein product, partial [Didymodactylos carnosus]
PPLISSVDPKKVERLAKIMKIRADAENELKERVLENPFNSRCKWDKLEDTQIAFPKMTEEQLRDLCFGTYQIKQARRYTEAHLNKNDGDYEVQVTKHSDTILRCKIDSRHSSHWSSTQYYCWIEYKLGDDDEEESSSESDDSSDEDDDDDEYTLVTRFYEKLPIKSWYCQCPTGERSCGCCAHIACVLWYLCYERHHQFTPSKYTERYRQTLDNMETN